MINKIGKNILRLKLLNIPHSLNLNAKLKFVINSKYFSENLPQEIKTETEIKLEKLNKLIPLDQLDKQVLEDVKKYKVLEDSMPMTIERLKEEVPEIKDHIKFREYIKSVIDLDQQEEILRKEGIVILKNKLDVFHKYGIDTHNYRNFHDKDYEVDIEEVLTKDLYEKQRVVDNYAEEKKSQVNELIGFYNNRFKYTKFNKYNYLIFQNNYMKSMNNIKLNLLKNISSVSLLSFVFYLINPYLMILLLPEYFSILYMFNLLNSLVDQIILVENKSSLLMRTFNFLGFKRDYPKSETKILKLRYDKKIKNDILNLNDKGFFFITRIIRRYLKKDETKLDNFKYFHRLRSFGKSYLLPADLSTQHEDTNEDLILSIINKDVKTILEYDYSTYEDRMSTLINYLEAFKKESQKKRHVNYVTEEEKLKTEYSNLRGNRDFSDNNYEMTFKRSDGADGTYINNGYR